MSHQAHSLLRGIHRMFAVMCLCFVAPAFAADPTSQNFDLPAGDAEKTLKLFTQQSGEQILYPPTKVSGVQTNAVKGEMTPGEALKAMLDKTQLVAVRDQKTGAYTVQKAASTAEAEKNAPSRRSNDSAATDEPKVVELPTFEVMGSKLLNMDIRRSRDDVQPYVVFDRAKIEHSGALTVGDFLKEKLTANATSATSDQFTTGFLGTTSNVNLRGLGSGQTLILIDGRRTATAINQGSPTQQDLNGIPLSAIERIEVLPTSASGIYGGSATGGVVNVVLRRDYAGVEVKLTYQNTFDTDAAIRRADIAAGMNFNHGKTNLMITGSYTDGNTLASQDRNFVRRGRVAVMANNPASIVGTTTLPTGSTPNIRSANGSNLVLKNGTPLNSPITFVPAGYAGMGPAADGGVALVANAGRYNLDLSEGTIISGNAGYPGRLNNFLNVATITSGSAAVRHQFSSQLQGFLEVGAANNVSHSPKNVSLLSAINLPASAPNNPFTTAVLVQVPDTSAEGEAIISFQSRRVAAGLIIKLPKSWMGEADHTWSRGRQYTFAPATQTAEGTAALASGAIDVLRDTRQYPLNLTEPLLQPFQSYTSQPFRSTSNTTTLRFSGPAGRVPGGVVTLSTLLEYGREKVADAIVARSPTTANFFPSKSQDVGSAYVEASLPLLRRDASSFLPGDLDVQLAGRYDRYATTGATSTIPLGSSVPIVRETNKFDSWNPTIGLRFGQLAGTTLRVSYGTGFLPPNITQIVGSENVQPTNVATDPRRGNQPTLAGATIRSGGSATLQPEKSRTWSGGIIFAAKQIPGLRLSVDYSRIEKTEVIISPATQQLIDSESLFPDRIGRGANLPGDQAGWAGPITFIDRSLLNASSASMEALDFQLDYELKTASAGSFELSASATRMLGYRVRLLATLPAIEYVGYGVNSSQPTDGISPARLKLNGGLVWRKGPWTAGWSFSLISSYQNYLPTDSATTVARKVLSQGNETGVIPSQIYHDVFASYRFERKGRASGPTRLLGGLDVQVGIKNVLNTEPPLDFGNTGFFYSYYGDPRLARYYISLKRSF